MAILQVNEKNTLQLQYDLGMSGNRQLTRRKTYTGVKEEAAVENLYDVASTLAGLQTNPLEKVYLNETNQLKEE